MNKVYTIPIQRRKRFLSRGEAIFQRSRRKYAGRELTDRNFRSKMLIVNAVAMLTRKSGDYIYRVEQPSIAMGNTGKATVITASTISPWFESLCLAADILIVHLLSEHDLLPILVERKSRRLPVIYELSDNIVAPHTGVGIKGWFSDPLNLALSFQYLRMADAVQVTGPGLEERFKFGNPRTIIFANQIDSMGSLARPDSRRITIGWAGSTGHLRDVESTIAIVGQVMRRHLNVDFALMADKEIYRLWAAALPAGRIRYTPPGTLAAYLDFLQTIDIGLAPLLDNPYNHCRSDVKFLEYASRGVVPVLSHITPYLDSAQPGETAFLYRSPQELGPLLTRLIADAGLRDRIRRAAYAYVNEHRREERHADERLTFYEGLLDIYARPGDMPPDLPRQRRGSGTGYFELTPSRAETHLLQGIVKDAEGFLMDARMEYKQAAAENPRYYLPWFWLGYSSLRHGDTDACQWLDEAIKRNPNALRARLLKAKCRQDQEPAQALDDLFAMTKRWPDYAPAALTMGELLERHSVHDEALHWYNHALDINPFCSPAALGMGRIYERQGDNHQAGRGFGAAADLAPPWAEAQYFMARWCLSQNDLDMAAEYCRRTILADAGHSEIGAVIKEIEKRGTVICE